MDAIEFRPYGVVGERCQALKPYCKGRWSAESENADMSSDKPDENSGRRKPKVSWGRFVLPGLVGS